MKLALTSQKNTMNALLSDSKTSIALDCWTSPDQKFFMTVIDYFISANLHFYEVLSDFSSLEGSHSDEHLASMLLDILKKHNLFHHVLDITTNNVCY